MTKNQKARAIKAGQKDGAAVRGHYNAKAEEMSAWLEAGFQGFRPTGSPATVQLFHAWITEYRIAYRLAAQGQCPR